MILNFLKPNHVFLSQCNLVYCFRHELFGGSQIQKSTEESKKYNYRTVLDALEELQSAMGTPNPLRTNKEKANIIFGPLLRHHNTKPSINANAEGVNSSLGLITANDNVNTLCKQGRLKEALNLLQSMDQQGIHPDFSTYFSLLRLCGDKKALIEGKLVDNHIADRRVVPDIFVANMLLNMYAKCGSLEDARRVFDKMPERNVVSWTVMVATYAKNGYTEEALHLFYRMKQMGYQPNQFTFSSVLPAFVNLGSLKQIHQEIIIGGFEYNVFVGSALVDMYGKCGCLQDARHIFDKMSERNVISWTAMIAGYAQNGFVEDAWELFGKMPVRDVVSWTAIIAGYVQNGYFDEALRLLQQMLVTGVKPSAETFASILSACSGLAAMEEGKKIHECVIRNGFQFDVFVANALVDFYAKCGSIKDACKMFDRISRRDVVSWNVMIGGYAMHGCGKEALQLFEEMRNSNITPDLVTFIGVLSACCHAGLVDDGCQYFQWMSRDYHLEPEMEHYCCMVDLLGRTGFLHQAFNFINGMPIKPAAAVWASLLGACKIHNNIELGECVAKQLFELDPEGVAPYVLLANMYAVEQRWDDLEKTKKLMNERKSTKKRGCSWIEVNKQVHVFIAGDRSHA